jgi:hypothetical protein
MPDVWEINKQYSRGDLVEYNSIYYICNIPHISIIPPGNEFISNEWIDIDTSFVNYIFPNKNLLYTPTYAKFRGVLSQNVHYFPKDIVTYASEIYICINQIMYSGLITELTTNFLKIKNFTETDPESKSDSGISFSQIPLITITTENSGTMTTQTLTFDFFGDTSTFSDGTLFSKPPLPKRHPSTDSEEEKKFKRKLDRIEDQIKEYNKKQRMQDSFDIRERILLLNTDIPTKAFILRKYDEQISRAQSGDRSKGIQWINTICDLPLGKYIHFPVKKTDSPTKIANFFRDIKKTLDEAVYGHEYVKQEILEFVAKMITNKNSKGQVLALQGSPGTAKTRLLKVGLAKALGFPFAQINFGGMNDANVLLGHDQTYVGSKPGKIVDILTKMGYMNGIMYFDEVDKISESKQKEIFGVLTHLLDPEQNAEFTDHYLGEVKLDLSKMFFVIAFNDLSQVDHIVSDRMKIIHIKSPSIEEKIKICEKVVLKELCKDVGIMYVETLNDEGDEQVRTTKRKRQLQLHFPKDIIEYITISKTIKEDGVRKLRRSLETVINRINMDYLLQKDYHNLDEPLIITKDLVDSILTKSSELSDHIHFSMYI